MEMRGRKGLKEKEGEMERREGQNREKLKREGDRMGPMGRGMSLGVVCWGLGGEVGVLER